MLEHDVPIKGDTSSLNLAEGSSVYCFVRFVKVPVVLLTCSIGKLAGIESLGMSSWMMITRISVPYLGFSSMSAKYHSSFFEGYNMKGKRQLFHTIVMFPLKKMISMTSAPQMAFELWLSTLSTCMLSTPIIA